MQFREKNVSGAVIRGAENILAHRKGLKRGVELIRARKTRMANFHRGLFGDYLIVEDDLAGARWDETRGDVEQCGLARTVRPAYAQNLTPLDVATQPVHRRHVAKIFGHALE